jgi:uncharacterized repeat protein (TIGR03806 family)
MSPDSSALSQGDAAPLRTGHYIPPSRVCLRIAFIGLLLTMLPACGGGGSSDREPLPITEDPFGLDVREPLADLLLPGTKGTGEGVTVEPAFHNLSFEQPLFLAQVPAENRLVVVEKTGRIKAFDRDADTASADTVLDLSDRVVTINEQGLLGLAFDPDFENSGFIYVHYSVATTAPFNQQSVIARFYWDGGSTPVDIDSEKVILEVPQPAVNHNAGMLAFGPDGMLYIGLGDGGGSGDPGDHGQNLGTLLGTLLRIDVHPADDTVAYGIPADNPFRDTTGARPEIWAYGLRNPWRFSFDRQTGELWLADVGQNAVEEINIIESGGNYGWRIWEGSRRFGESAHASSDDDFKFPVHEYENVSGASITGGYVYRGSALPGLGGWYVHGDFVTGQVWALHYDGNDVTANAEIGHVAQLSSFGEDAAGELYLISMQGTLHRLAELDPGAVAPTPELLSETRLFTDMTALEPAPGLLEYAVTVPQWADGAEIRRWIALPDDAVIDFHASGDWNFPVGTVLLQHLEIALTEGDAASRLRLETRLLIRDIGAWQHFTYRWNDDGTDAQLLAGRENLPLTLQTADGTEDFTYIFPSPTDCRQCHVSESGNVLGVRTRQLNRDFMFPMATDNQLRTWNHIGMFSEDIGATAALDVLPRLDDAAEPLAARARAWLDVNCAHCHRPGGTTQLDLDLRFATPAAEMNAIGAPRQSASFGIDADVIIAPGDREASMLWQRIRHVGSGRMPPISSNRVDAEGLSLVGEWIDTL